MNGTETIKTAVISDCGRYRYVLTRVWNKGICVLPIVMLNPSKADAELDDPTIRRCISFAAGFGYGGIMVTNLNAFRSPSPSMMLQQTDPMGPDNLKYLRKALGYAKRHDTHVLCAWGNHGDGRFFQEMAEKRGIDLHCLGTTKTGQPKHPLYVPCNQRLEKLSMG